MPQICGVRSAILREAASIRRRFKLVLRSGAKSLLLAVLVFVFILTFADFELPLVEEPLLLVLKRTPDETSAQPVADAIQLKAAWLRREALPAGPHGRRVRRAGLKTAWRLQPIGAQQPSKLACGYALRIQMSEICRLLS